MDAQAWAQIVDGIVINILWWDGNTDGSAGGWPIPEGNIMVPLQDGTVSYTGTATIGLAATQVGDAWVFDVPPPIVIPPPTPEEILAANTQQLVGRLGQIGTRASNHVLMSMDFTGKSDTHSLAAKVWQDYYNALFTIDLTVENPPWPTLPTA